MICNFSCAEIKLSPLKLDIVSFPYHCFSQVSEEESTSHLRNASGISRASPALSALFHWWVLVSSLMVKESCAATATATYRAAIHLPLTLPLTYRSPSVTAFQEPQVITEEGNTG